MSVSHPLLKLLKVSVLEVHREVGCIRDINLKLHPLCQIVEDILRLGLLRTGSWFNKVDYWNVMIKLSRKAGPGVYHILEFVKDCKKTVTDQGRGRLFIRACLEKNQLACAVRLLKGDPVVLHTHYDPSSSIVRDEILIGGVMIDLIKLYNRHHQTLHFDTSMNDLDLNSRSCGYEIFLSLLEEVSRITFRLNLKNSSFLDETWELAELRDYEFVPCEVLGIQFQSVDGHLLVTDVDKGSVAAEDRKVQVGDILDELFGHSLKGAKKSKVTELFQLYKGIPVYASFIKVKDSNGHVHRHVSKLLRKADIVMVAPARQKRRATKKQEGDSAGGGSRKPPPSVLPEDEQDEIPVHGSEGRTVYEAIYRGQHPLKGDGRVDRIHDAVGAIVHNPDKLEELVTICTTETTIVVTRKSDGKKMMEHSFPEVSACGRRTDYMSYFAYIAGETTCNLAKNFQCFVFESEKADEAKFILCSIAQGFERTQWFL